MSLSDKRAVKESLKPENKGVYVFVQKFWGKYSVIQRHSKRDAAATYDASKGYKSSVAIDGALVFASVDGSAVRKIAS